MLTSVTALKPILIQSPFFSQVPLHSRGELLFGLAEG
jgi:hypothetical protein